MAFLRAQVYENRERFLIAENLEDAVFCKYNGIQLPVGSYDVDELPEDEDLAEEIVAAANEFRCTNFEIVEQFYGCLEPHGCYTDRSGYTLGDSIQDVAQQMLDLYFDGDPEYMDEGEKEDVAFLEGLL